MKNNKIRLNNNCFIPSFGLGTWKSEKTKAGQAVDEALKVGYEHIDCASVYGNEKEIGEAFSKVFSSGNIKRENIFITSKLWNTQHHPDNVENACRKTLLDLQLNYLDLYLIHWGIAFKPGKDKQTLDRDGVVVTEPVPVQKTWQAMEALVDAGLVKSIGVSNFTTPMLVDLLSYAKIKPVVNQIEIHPYNSQADLVNFCHRNSIAVTAYSPLGSSGDVNDRPMNDGVVISIAQSHQKTPAQVLIRWSIQRGLIVIPKTVSKDRVSENMNVFDFELSGNEMRQINKLNRNHRYLNPQDFWGIPYFD